jgi:DNA-binding transcriptional regulator YiaG
MPTIKELRQKTGLSQNKFAQKYHIHTTTLQHWEQGVSKTPETILYLLERVIDYETIDK